MAPEFIETRDIAVSGADLAGAESAVVLDAFSAQGEYVLVDMNPRDGGDVDARGYYVAGAYSLTGEHRAYDRAYGRFGRITPDSPFLSEEGGPGAWEIAARYSLLDLDDERIPRGGEMADYTLGVNWHLNDAVCVMSTYVHSHLDDIGSARFFAIRFGIVF